MNDTSATIRSIDMRGYYEIDSKPDDKPTTMGLPHPPVGAVNKKNYETQGAGVYAHKEGRMNLCRVESCNQREYVNTIVKVDDDMAACIQEHKSGRVLTLNGASTFLYNPVLISIGQEGGL